MSKVALGLSGGVDSSVAVHLLQAAGHEVVGIHMRLVPESGIISFHQFLSVCI